MMPNVTAAIFLLSIVSIWTNTISLETPIPPRSQRGKYPQLELWKVYPNAAESTVLQYHRSESKYEHYIQMFSAFGMTYEASKELLQTHPYLTNLEPTSIVPKIRYFVYTILGSSFSDVHNNAGIIRRFPPSLLGSSLEKNTAPRFAYLRFKSSDIFQQYKIDNYGSDPEWLTDLLTLSDEDWIASLNRYGLVELSQADFTAFRTKFWRGGLQAVRELDSDLVQILLKQGWNPDDDVDRSGRSPLMWAVSLGRNQQEAALRLTHILLHEASNLRARHHESLRSVSGDVSFKSLKGDSCAHWAASGGSLEICRLLQNVGADFSEPNNELTTPLHWAAGSGSLDVLSWLMSMGLDPERRNIFGCTAAHFASSGGQLDVCQYLQTKGVDLTAKNYHGHDPVTKAISYKRNDVAKWLIDQVPGVRESLLDKRPWIDDTTLPKEIEVTDLEKRKVSLREIASIVNNVEALSFLPQ